MKEKKRLDLVVIDKNPSFSRNYVQSIIMQGKVTVDGKPCTKPGTQVSAESEIEVIAEQQKYVSRAGLKLEKALDSFNINVSELVVLDAGISTGGFTDCLLQRGAKRVYGIDVGYGQVHEKISKDPRVVIMEKTNLRHLEKLPELVDLATLDLSFISVLKVIPAVSILLAKNGKIIILIKPQFEAGKEDVGRGGIIKDEKVHQKVIEKVKLGMDELGFCMEGLVESPILGGSGNKEFLGLFVKKSLPIS